MSLGADRSQQADGVPIARLSVSSVHGGSFGSWTSRSVNIGKHPFTVVYGRNEAGKSTLATMIAWLLVGADSASSALRRFADQGSYLTGELQGFIDDAAFETQGRFSVTKNDQQSRGGLSAHSGTQFDQHQWRARLGGADPTTYTALYRIAGEQLHAAGAVEDVLNRLMFAGDGPVLDPRSVAAGLAKSAKDISESRAKNAESVVTVASEIQAARQVLSMALSNADRCRDATNELRQLDDELAIQRVEYERSRSSADTLRVWLEALPVHATLRANQRQLESIEAIPSEWMPLVQSAASIRSDRAAFGEALVKLRSLERDLGDIPSAAMRAVKHSDVDRVISAGTELERRAEVERSCGAAAQNARVEVANAQRVADDATLNVRGMWPDHVVDDVASTAVDEDVCRLIDQRCMQLDAARRAETMSLAAAQSIATDDGAELAGAAPADARVKTSALVRAIEALEMLVRSSGGWVRVAWVVGLIALLAIAYVQGGVVGVVAAIVAAIVSAVVVAIAYASGASSRSGGARPAILDDPGDRPSESPSRSPSHSPSQPTDARAKTVPAGVTEPQRSVAEVSRVEIGRAESAVRSAFEPVGIDPPVDLALAAVFARRLLAAKAAVRNLHEVQAICADADHRHNSARADLLAASERWTAALEPFGVEPGTPVERATTLCIATERWQRAREAITSQQAVVGSIEVALDAAVESIGRTARSLSNTDMDRLGALERAADQRQRLERSIESDHRELAGLIASRPVTPDAIAALQGNTRDGLADGARPPDSASTDSAGPDSPGPATSRAAGNEVFGPVAQTVEHIMDRFTRDDLVAAISFAENVVLSTSQSVDERIARRTLIEQERNRLTAEHKLEDAQFRISSLEDRRRELARQAYVHAVASMALLSACDSYELRTQPELLRRASDRVAQVVPDVERLVARRSKTGVELMATYRGEPTRPLHQLSTGARAVMYLACRFALIDVDRRRRGVALPVLVDEPFAHVDDDRRTSALELLVEMARDHDVVVFTCSRSQRDACISAGAHEVSL